MHFLHASKNWIATTLGVAIVLVGISVPYTHTGQPQIAEAQRATVVVGGNGTIQETISAGANTVIAGIQTTLNIKELTLDGIAWGLAKTMVQSMTSSIVNWINSGFEGKPAFMSDLKSHLINRADEILGDFVANDPSLNFLCSPFKFDVRAAVELNYQEQTRGSSAAQCTLSDVSDNIEGFLSGNFADGGWPAMFELTQKPHNTPTGAYLNARAELAARIVDDQNQTLRELDWGNGFLSFKVCDDNTRGSGNPNQNCDITTPGAVIADQLNKSLGAGQDALIEADEINEILAALFRQLAKKAITGANGLLGLGGSDSYSGSSYGPSGNQSFLEAMAEEDAVTDGSDIAISEKPIQDAIAAERSYRNLHQDIINRINNAEEEIARLNEIYQDDDDKEPNFCVFNLQLPADLERERDDAAEVVAESDARIAEMQSILANYNAATNATERSEAMEPFLQLVANNETKNETQITVRRFNIQTDFDPRLAAFNQQIQQVARNCGGGGDTGDNRN